MAFVKTDLEKNKILVNDKNKLKQQIKNKQKELHLQDMHPLHGQNEYTQLQNIQSQKNHIQQLMSKTKEERQKRQKEERIARRKSIKEKTRMYFAQQERKSKDAYNKRRIIFHNGQFQKYISNIVMLSQNVLLKQQIQKNKEGIIIPDDYKEKYPVYTIISFNKQCLNINVGDEVITQAYSGIEIKDEENIYKIVNINDILLKLIKN